MLYRIYTERGNWTPKVLDATSELFDGFTVMNTVGYWKKQSETSMVIEIYTPKPEDDKVAQLAKTIKRLGNQESVLVLRIQADTLEVQ